MVAGVAALGREESRRHRGRRPAGRRGPGARGAAGTEVRARRAALRAVRSVKEADHGAGHRHADK